MKSAMHAATQLSGRGAPLMWMLPLCMHVNQKSGDDDDDGDDACAYFGSHRTCIK